MRTAIVISILAALAACTDTPGEPTVTDRVAAPDPQGEAEEAASDQPRS